VRSHPIQTAADFRFIYRGYDLEVTRAPSGWRVGVYPRTADLPISTQRSLCLRSG